MKQFSDYEKLTKDAYLTSKRAAEYKQFHTRDLSWGRFVTFLEQRAIERELRNFNWSETDLLLDIPCGTGVLGPLMYKFPFKIIASDISSEMMMLARAEYPQGRLVDCVEADITCTPFERESFACVITLGFLHRVPPEIKRAAIKEIASLSGKLSIASCSVDSRTQRFKHWLLSVIKPNHVPAPCPESMKNIISAFEMHGLKVVKAFKVMPILSAHTLFVLEK